MKTIDKTANLDEEGLIERNKEGFIELPKELDDAPEEIKAFYIKWVETGERLKGHPRRYFSFVNQKTQEDETVDAAQLSGQAVRKAIAKNISKEDLKVLEAVCREIVALKQLKTKLKFKWMAYVRPKLGKDIFDWRKADIIELFARYYSYEEVKKTINDWGFSADINLVYKFFLNNKDIIDKKRLDFLRSSRDHYLATDAGRMETLAMLHSRFIGLFNEAYKSAAPPKEELRALSREIRSIVEQARKEIKGDEIKLTVDGKIDINASLQANATIQEVSKRIPINMIPVYLVAVKQGISPHRILASLVNSFYKDFNGFSAITGNGAPPSTMELIRNYDWGEIRQYQKDKQPEEGLNITEYEEVPFTEVSKVQSKRQKLMDIINNEITENPSQV